MKLRPYNIILFLYLPNNFNKTFDLPNENVQKHRKCLHLYHVELLVKHVKD